MLKIKFYVLFLLLTLNLNAFDVPRVISYQGVLLDNTGKPFSGPIEIEITIVDISGAPHPSGFLHKESFILQGGLFLAKLGQKPESSIDFPILEGNWFLNIKESKTGNSFKVPLFSSPMALNIPDNTVTSAKIKDGEVKSDDLDVMGASEGQVLTRKSNNWVGYDVPTELPTGNEGDVLVNRNGKWVAEKQTVPTGVPVGTIVAFGGEKIPDGWLLCDGRTFNVALNPEYQTLSDAIGTSWGGNSTLKTFNLPDLRGRFLRGVDYGLGRDPDANSRTKSNEGGNAGDKVGSLQGDLFLNHSHTLNIPSKDAIGSASEKAQFVRSGWQGNWLSGDLYTNSQGGNETRPKNVAVNWIIKAK